MAPLAQPGPLTDVERFMFEATGYLVIPEALSDEETDACLEASRRTHTQQSPGEWRQIGHLSATEPAPEDR